MVTQMGCTLLSASHTDDRQTDSRKDLQTMSATANTLKPGLGLRCSMTEASHHNVSFGLAPAVSSPRYCPFSFLSALAEALTPHHTTPQAQQEQNSVNKFLCSFATMKQWTIMGT